MKLEITKKEKCFIYELSKYFLFRIATMTVSMLFGWLFLIIGLIDEMWGIYLATVLVINAFVFGKDYVNVKQKYARKIFNND